MSSTEKKYLVGHRTDATLEQFWKAVNIWNNSPHVVNRRLCGTICLFSGKILLPEEDHDILISKVRSATISADTPVTNDHILQCLKVVGLEAETGCNISEPGIFIYIKKLLPRNSDKFQPCLELVILDTQKNEAVFVGLQQEHAKPNLTPCFPYSLCYDQEKQEICLKLINDSNICTPTIDWLKEHLFSKIIKWAETANIEQENSGIITSSLNLINIAKYNELYQHLKKKYGLQLVKIWPENTDPLKFVYEDVAIATYLILLWEQERFLRGTPDSYQTFVDLGCGNGLLVHILNSEGHKGFGLDVRKRKIWDLYPASTKLQVQSIVPSAESLFPEADWLIGNHSDELTPWIPIIAARSSYSCRFFLLPCCCYELNGQKYQRANSSRSQYMDYLDYIQQLCEACGFMIKVDRLRIPSTKRICLVGSERHYPKEDMVKVDEYITKLIDRKTRRGMETVSEEQSDSYMKNESLKKVDKKWMQDFKVRVKEERVRNCTRLHKGLVNEIVALVAKELLNKGESMLVGNSEGKERLWNAGGTLLLKEMASLIPVEQLKKLKNECGGLQTLLKNNGHVFLVENGKVKLKVPSVQSILKKKKSILRQKSLLKRNNIDISRKQKPCWFQFNHPDGCPLSEGDCSYRH